MSRHKACKLPFNKVPNRVPVSIPVSIKPGPMAAGIIIQVQKVTADVTQLQERMAVESAARNDLEKQMAVESAARKDLEEKMDVESAARNDLQKCVDNLTAETDEVKKNLAQEPKNHNRQSVHRFMRMLPCNSLNELDFLLAYIGIHFLQWVRKKFITGKKKVNPIITGFRLSTLGCWAATISIRPSKS